MSYVNLENKKIVGASEGSLAWWHEKGHIIYNQSEKGIKNSYRMSFSFYLALTLIILTIASNISPIFSVVFIFGFWWYFIYEEIWCWNYAHKMKGGDKNGRMEKTRKRQR